MMDMEEKNNKKSGFVAIVGRPNVGKSTLLNNLIGTKIAITSNRPQTTRNTIRGIFTDDRGQIVFFDTPGLHKAKNRLGEFMVHTAQAARKDADLVLWLVEPDEKIGPGDRRIAQSLSNIGIPVFLVINKTDMIPRENILKVIDSFKDLMDFDEIFPISAIKGEGCLDLLDTIFSKISCGPFFYDEDEITDQPLRQMCAEIVREKSLHALKDEVPHGIAVLIDKMEQGKNIWHIYATIVCERDSHKGMIIGKNGAMLKKIGSTARYEMEKLLEMQVNLKLWVKVKKDWRNSGYLVQNFGYRDED